MKRLLNMIKGFFSYFLSGIEKSNPEMLLNNEKENLRKQMAQFNTGLAEYAGRIESDLALSKSLATEESDLKSKIEQLLRVNKRETASTLALRMQAVVGQKAEVLGRLNVAEAKYKELTSARDIAIGAAKKKIEALSHGLTDLKMQKATAEMTEMANGMISSIGGGGDTLDRLSQQIEEERSKATGRVRVAQDSEGFQALKADEALNKDLAELALADFEASLGITSKGAETSSIPATKVMG